MIGTRLVLKNEELFNPKLSVYNPELQGRIESALSWNQAAENVAHEVAVKTGSINKNKVRGVSDYETDLMRRISAASENPSYKDSGVRTQERVNQFLKEQQAQLKEDRARARKYEAELKATLQDYY